MADQLSKRAARKLEILRVKGFEEGYSGNNGSDKELEAAGLVTITVARTINSKRYGPDTQVYRVELTDSGRADTLTAQDKADRQVAEQARALLWAVATSNNPRLAAFNSAAYKGAEDAFDAAIKIAYDLSDAQVSEVRGLCSEFGPHDMSLAEMVTRVRKHAKALADVRVFKGLPNFMRRQATDDELAELADAAVEIGNWELAEDIEQEQEARELAASDPAAQADRQAAEDASEGLHFDHFNNR